MIMNSPKEQDSQPKKSVIEWLLDSDPSIRWQVMQDLTGAPAEEVAAERARVATQGWGARLLALQGVDGRWGGAAWNRGWNATLHLLMLLHDLGLDPASNQARRALGLVRDGVTWKGCGSQEFGANPFFAGELEPCINGQVGKELLCLQYPGCAELSRIVALIGPRQSGKTTMTQCFVPPEPLTALRTLQGKR